MRRALPVFVVTLALIAFWYVMAIVLNSAWTNDRMAREDRVLSTFEHIADTWSQEKPRLPAPHQLAAELWNTVALKPVTSNKSLVHHAWITLSATLLGFAIGSGLGILLATGIVHNRAMDLSVMPWAIASQTIPILAIAPMIIVVLNAVGISGLIPKAIISAYLSFFPVVVGMVKGLRSPDPIQLDQMQTWNATKAGTFWKLRLPSSVPYLFTSLKVGIAAALIGAIVGELPTGAVAGLGARLLSGSYYGQTIQIWSALFMAATLAATLVAIVGLIERIVSRRMGFIR